MIIMDYTKNTSDYIINLLADHHLANVQLINTSEGYIAVLNKYDEHRSLYRDTTQDTATDIAWCTKEIAADDTVTYTLVATSPVGTDVEVNTVLKSADDATVDYGTVYFIGEAETNWYEFTLRFKGERLYVKCSQIKKEMLDELEALTNMGASKLMEEILAKEYAKLATITMTNGGSVLSLDDKGTAIDANKFKVTYIDATLRRKISDYNFEVKMLNADDTASNLPKVTLTAKTYDGCTAVVPTAYTNGFAKVRVYFTWHITEDETNYRIYTDVTLTDWNDPVIMVDTLSTYDELSGYGMMISPAVADPDNFAGCKDLTDEQMANGTAMKVLINQNLITATAAKVAYLESFGLTTAEATDKALTFMTLSEAKAVTQLTSSRNWVTGLYGYFNESTGIDLNDNEIVYNPKISTIVNGTSVAGIDTAIDLDNSTLYTLTHFESFAYFINCICTGVIYNAANQIGAFENTKNLVTVYWPLGVNIDAACFRGSGIINLQTLLD